MATTMRLQTSRFILTSLAAAAALAACGGGDNGIDTSGGSAASAAAMADGIVLQPSYELAPTLPPEPSDIDADGSGASAGAAPGRSRLLGSGVPGESGEDMRQRIQSARGGADTASAAAAASTAVYYTPAQIRAAYGVDKLPATTTANKGAYQGSGQTIAIIGAYNNASAATDLAGFSAKFGLAPCAVTLIAATATLPLAKPAAGSGCSFSVVNASSAGTIASRAPAANSGWATETSMDIEWAHAIAPMARIILVQAATASVADMSAAIALAGRMGATVVSMSFGAGEFSSMGSYEGAFLASGVSYLASSGDSGRAVSWPAVSPRVLAIGGTSLATATTAAGTTRSETAWSGSGGGISAYNAVPAWQANLSVIATTGKAGVPTKRVLPDVSLNANPSTGQLILAAGAWYVAGGTSVSAPQWAGLAAVANAVRALNGKAVLGNLGQPVYRALNPNPTTYAAALLDVKSGSNGSCKGCSATASFDLVTGLGTPNAGKTVELLASY